MVFALLAITEPLHAVSLAISPQIVELLVNPGSTTDDAISYTNTGTTPVALSIELTDFTIGADGKAVELPPGTHGSTLVPYLKISPLRINVAAGQKVYIRYSIQAPAQFTHLRTMVYFVARPTQKPTGRAAVVLVPRIGMPIYLENRQAKAAALQVGDVRWQRDPKGVVLHVPVTNDGERLYRPGGFVQVKSAGGTKNFAFNDGGNPVLPGQTREFAMPLTEVGGGELSLQLRVMTSARGVYNRDYRIAAGDTPPSSH